LLWTRFHSGPGPGGGASAAAIAVSPTSSKVFVTGTDTGKSGGSDFFTIAYASSTGTTRWGVRYDGPAHLDDTATDIGVSPDGTMVFVTGYGGSDSSNQIVVNAHDASNGATVWSRRMGGPQAYDEAYALAVSPDGAAVYVAGVRRDEDGTDLRVVALDASTGSTLWGHSYEGPSHLSVPRDVRVSPDGSMLFVVGTTEIATDVSDAVTLAYDTASGDRVWKRRFDGSAQDRGIGIEVAPDGNTVFVADASQGPTNYFDYVTFAYDAATGSRLWRNIYNGPADRTDIPSAIGVSPDGSRVFVTGYTTVPISFSYDYATIALDSATGEQAWVKRYDDATDQNEGLDKAVDLGVSPDGSKVYVTGTSEGGGQASTYEDFATQGYDAVTGKKLGVKRFDACESQDMASALAVSPNGSSVFVAGTTPCPEPGLHGFATLAYQA
jgi:3D (Asp-Asp-Asp) domain-containing protein